MIKLTSLENEGITEMDFDPENYEDKKLLEILDSLAEHDSMSIVEASIIDELINRENLEDYE